MGSKKKATKKKRPAKKKKATKRKKSKAVSPSESSSTETEQSLASIGATEQEMIDAVNENAEFAEAPDEGMIAEDAYVDDEMATFDDDADEGYF